MRIFLFILCALELMLITYWRNFAGPYISPVLLLSSSLGIGLVYLKIVTTPASFVQADQKINPKITRAVQLLLFCVLSYIVIKTLKTIWWWDITQHSVIDKSDIIPTITIVVKRFLAHEQPYSIIHYKDYDLTPNYLPFQWMPYILTEITHKDYRWIPAIFLWLASFYFFIRNFTSGNENTPILLKIIIPIWPLAVWYTLILYNNPMFNHTVEGLIAAYYLFVATSIGRRHILPLAIGIALCLLSRFSIILWVPLCLVTFFIAGEKKKAFVTTGILFLFFVLFYWLPFLRKDPMIFINGYRYYSVAALTQWQYDLQLHQHGFVLLYGLGFTSWALKLVHGDLQHILSVYQATHLAVCLFTIIVLIVFYWVNRQKVSLNVFLLFSFKIYLAVFYSFIQVPYNYLFLVPVIVSSALLAGAFNSKWLTAQGKK